MKKALIVGLVLAFTAGLCLAAKLTASTDAKPWQSRLRTPPQTVKSPYVPPARLDPKVWHINESFEGSFPPAGWTVQNVAGASITWVQSSSSVHSGSYSAFINYDCSGYSEDWLITPQVTIQSNDTLYFWLDIYDFGYPPDTTKVMISTTDNQPASFDTVLWQQWDGGGYVNAWTGYAVDLSAYAGQSVYLAFRHNNNCGDGVFVDDVRIGHEYTPVPGDLALESIDEPSGSFVEPGLPFTPAVTVENSGTTPATDFYVVYSVDDGVTKALVYEDTVFVNSPDSLFPDSARQFTFDDLTPLDLTNYYVTAYVAAPGDPNQANDTLHAYFRTFNELQGQVADDNAGGAGLAGVKVKVTGPATDSTFTDGSGDYFFFDLAAGTYTVTAAKAGYITETATGITITDNMQTTLDIGMGYPELVLTPTDSIYCTLPWGGADSTTWQFTLENAGTRDMAYSVSWPELVKGAKAPVSLVLDDGTAENNIGLGGTIEMLFGNRFTPTAGEFPFTLNQVQAYFSSAGLVNVGDDIQILVYENTTGGNDPAVGANLLYTYPTTAQVIDGWSVYDLPAPVVLNGPGDVFIAVLALEVPGTNYWPAALDQTATQQRSWAGWWNASPPPVPPTLPSDNWTLIDAYFPGNWMVRGYGETGGGNVVWLDISPASGTVPAYDSELLEVTFDAAGLDSLTDHAANVTFNTNAMITKRTDYVPAYLHVVGTGVSGGPSQPLSYAFGLNANRPNPVSGRTSFSFTLPRAQDYSLKVYNVSGQLVESFAGKGQAGANSVNWNAQKAGAGVYLYRLSSGGQSATRKLVVLR